MKAQELILICLYSEEQTVAEVIGSSLSAFLRKKLQDVENGLPSAL